MVSNQQYKSRPCGRRRSKSSSRNYLREVECARIVCTKQHLAAKEELEVAEHVRGDTKKLQKAQDNEKVDNVIWFDSKAGHVPWQAEAPVASNRASARNGVVALTCRASMVFSAADAASSILPRMARMRESASPTLAVWRTHGSISPLEWRTKQGPA